MKFYVIEIADGDAKIKGKSIYEYENKTDALAMFHKKLGTAMSSELYTTEQIICVDENNNIHAIDKFVRGE